MTKSRPTTAVEMSGDDATEETTPLFALGTAPTPYDTAGEKQEEAFATGLKIGTKGGTVIPEDVAGRLDGFPKTGAGEEASTTAETGAVALVLDELGVCCLCIAVNKLAIESLTAFETV